MIPQRIQRKRTKGWRKPEGAVYVGRGSTWGNPYRVTSERDHSLGCQVWFVAHQNHPHETVGSFGPEHHLYEGPQWRAHCFAVELFELMLAPTGTDGTYPTLDIIRTDLAGKNLMCWCPLNQPCHADALLELANGDRLPLGTPVLFWPGARVGEGRQSVTRTPIFKMGDGTEVVSVEGYPGGIALTHIQTLPVGATTTGLDQTPSTTPEAR